MGRVDGVLHDAGGPLPASGGIDVRGGGKAAPNNPLCIHYPVESFPLCSTAAAVPHSDAETEDTLSHTSVEGGQDRAPEFNRLQSLEEIQQLMSLSNQI